MYWFTYVSQGKDIVNVAFPNCIHAFWKRYIDDIVSLWDISKPVGLKTVLLRIVVSIYATKILAKETDVFVPIALYHGFVGSVFH